MKEYEAMKCAYDPNRAYYGGMFNSTDRGNSQMNNYNWSAMIGGPFWALYRKMYARASILLLIELCTIVLFFPLFPLVISIVHGSLFFTANNTYRKFVKKVVNKAENNAVEDKESYYKAKLGVNKWLPFVVLILFVIFCYILFTYITLRGYNIFTLILSLKNMPYNY